MRHEPEIPDPFYISLLSPAEGWMNEKEKFIAEKVLTSMREMVKGRDPLVIWIRTSVEKVWYSGDP